MVTSCQTMEREVLVSAARRKIERAPTSLFRGVPPYTTPPAACFFSVINRQASIVRRGYATVDSGNNPQWPGLPGGGWFRSGRVSIRRLIAFSLLPLLPQPRPIFQPLLDLPFEAAVDRVVEHLARHPVGEIV